MNLIFKPSHFVVDGKYFFHFAFDYIFNNRQKDGVCGEVLSGWPKMVSNSTQGYPPNYENIPT